MPSTDPNRPEAAFPDSPPDLARPLGEVSPDRKPRRGDRFECRIAGLGRRGEGLARVELPTGSFLLAVRGALPGARVIVEVGKRRKHVLEARVTEMLEESPDALASRCRHVASCGGCSFQHLRYERQLEALHDQIVAALEDGGVALAPARGRSSDEPGDSPTGIASDGSREGADGGASAASGARPRPCVEPVHGCAEPWRYRNKMDFTFGSRRYVEDGEPEGVDADFALGLHAPGRWEKVLDIHECHLAFEGADAIVASVRELARDMGLEPWDVQSHSGLLRHLVLRRAFGTGELLAHLVTSEEAPDRIEPFARALLERHPEITTLVQGINTRHATVAIGERELCLHGPGRIIERLGGLEFELSAASFFQTNTRQAEKLVELVRAEAAPRGDELLYDLYCGAGTLGLTLARDVRELWGFESVPEAIADARRNAERNGVTNAHFLCGDVLALLTGPEQAARPRPDVALVDPPRAGLNPKVVPLLVALAPRRLVYVSCNIHAAAADVAALEVGGYALTRVQAVDLFPHTPHVECVLTLERQADG